jgi:CheY-like chemotaxis protein
MERWKFTREFKLEAVRLIKNRGVSGVTGPEGSQLAATRLGNTIARGRPADPAHGPPPHSALIPIAEGRAIHCQPRANRKRVTIASGHRVGIRLRIQMRDATLAFNLRHPRNVMTSLTASPSDDLNGLRVLVVEDSWQVGTGLKTLLASWGARVIGPVPTTADAMLLFSQEAPDVALVDVSLQNGELSYGLIDWLHDRGSVLSCSPAMPMSP